MKHTPILLVDDEEKFVDMLAKRLELRGVISEVAYDGESAIGLMKKNSHPLVVLDLRLPDFSGTDILRQIKKNHPKAFVIMLTGHGSETDRAVCIQMGASEFLNKPVKIDELTRLIKKVLENCI